MAYQNSLLHNFVPDWKSSHWFHSIGAKPSLRSFKYPTHCVKNVGSLSSIWGHRNGYIDLCAVPLMSADPTGVLCTSDFRIRFLMWTWVQLSSRCSIDPWYGSRCWKLNYMRITGVVHLISVLKNSRTGLCLVKNSMLRIKNWGGNSIGWTRVGLQKRGQREWLSA